MGFPITVSQAEKADVSPVAVSVTVADTLSPMLDGVPRLTLMLLSPVPSVLSGAVPISVSPSSDAESHWKNSIVNELLAVLFSVPTIFVEFTPSLCARLNTGAVWLLLAPPPKVIPAPVFEVIPFWLMVLPLPEMTLTPLLLLEIVLHW